MKPLLISLLLLSCSGEAFNEQVGDTSAIGGSSGEGSSRGGALPYGGGSAGVSGERGGYGSIQGDSGHSGGVETSSSTSGSGGATAMAGRPPMGEGGETNGGPAQCLVDHQTLECARVCNSSPYCQSILDCFVSKNSDLTSDCPGFSDTGYSLAAQAVRNCCHD